ncbi:MAG: integrin alpha, partial [Myxococcota bacterium]|nr:integrin alpha [Myxococcota bacterium]
NAGAVYILFMNSDGTIKATQKISATSGGFTGVLNVGDDFGASLAAVGDLDGDGDPELLVGAPDDDEVGDNAGAVWVLFLNPDGSVKAESKISSSGGGLSGPLDVGDHFGSSLTTLGDIDGDGSQEIVVGSPNDDDGGENAGAVFVLSLDASGLVVAEQKISALSGGFGGVLDVGDHFGSAVASMGDHDVDGVADVAVGSPGDDDGGENAGAVYVLLLDAGGAAQAETKIATGSGGFTGALDIGDDFGHSLANVGDLNGDGFADLATGTPDDDDAGDNAGALYLLLFDSVVNDCDGNGVPDACDVDCNGNGQPDACDIANDPSIDCNGNDIPDECDIASGFSADCDGNLRPDECDIADDPSL